MRADLRVWLSNMRDAAVMIESFVAGMDESSYAASEMVRAAVERKFEIIGEALNQLSKADPAVGTRIPHARQIIGFRNVLVHGYASVDDKRVWRTIQNSLPALREAVEALLAEFGGSDT